MLFNLSEEQINAVIGVLGWQIECETGDPEQEKDVANLTTIRDSIKEQLVNARLWQAICEQHQGDVRHLNDTINRLNEEHNSLMEEIASEVELAMRNMGFENPDADVVGGITLEAYRREYGEDDGSGIYQIDLRDRCEIIDEIMAERYL